MMYGHLYGFNRPPFGCGLEEQELFRAPRLDELHERLRTLVENRRPGLLTGEPGSGKSTALRRLRDELHPEQVRTVYLHDTAVNSRDFCRQLVLELGLVPPFSRPLALRAVQQEVRRLADERHLSVFLVLDEAQALRADVLALLPILTNFDWGNHAPSPSSSPVRAACGRPFKGYLEPLAQRLTVRYALRGFDRETTKLYLEHRLKVAGLDRPLFTEPAVEALWQSSQGVMRRIDTLAHQALLAAAAERAQAIDPEHVLKAAEETRA